MAEYAGFEKREGTDFAKSINDLSTVVSGLEKKVKDVRISDKKLMTDNDALLDAHKPFNFTGTVDLAAKAAVTIRKSMYELNRKLNNREISPSDYRLAMQNIRTDHTGLIGVITTIDDRTLEEKKRIEPGPNGELPIASGIETELYAEMNKFWTELPDKQIFVGPNGKLATAQTDANGKIVEGSIFDLASQLNVNNIATNRLNLRDGVAKDVKELGDYSVFTINADGSTKDISAVEMDPEFDKYKKQIAGRYINNSNPKAIASVLVDNSNEGYMVYTTEESKENKIKDQLDILRLGATKENPFDEAKARKEIESKMIQLKQSENGVWNPVITDDLKNAAYKIVSNEIMSQLGYDEKGTGKKVQPTRDKGLTEQQAKAAEEKRNANKYVYESSANAFLDTPRYDGLDTDNYSFKTYTASDGFRHVIATPYMSIDGIKTPDKKRSVDIVDPKRMTTYVKDKTGTTKYSGVNYDEGRDVWVEEGGELIYKFPEKKKVEAKKKEVKTSKPAGTVRGGSVR